MTDTADRTEAGTGREGFAELVDGVRATFRSGRTRPVEWRRRQLDALHQMLVDHEADLVEALHADLGRPAVEAYATDIGTSKAEIAYARKHVASWAKPRRVNPGLTSLPGRGQVIPEPYGVALIIAPWNYPVYLLLAPMAAAIAAGNAIVAKPSELAPASSAALARLVPRYVDEDAITLVEGGVAETTALLELPYDHIFFTGSTSVGRVVMKAAAEHLTPVTLELGGKSPVIVAADADLEVAARRIMWGKHINSAQTCIAPDYVLVEESVRDRLVDEMGTVVREFLGSDPAGSPDYARIVNDRHFARITGLLESAGGAVAHGGCTDPTTRFVEPTIIVDPDLDAPIMQEEIFGPLLPVLAVDSVDAAIDFVNDRPKPLALYVFSGSGATVDHVLASTSSGGACVNHTLLHINSPSLPFGGVGPSGMGSYHGKAGFDAFSHHKSVLLKPQRPDPKLLYPPYTSLKERIIRTAM